MRSLDLTELNLFFENKHKTSKSIKPPTTPVARTSGQDHAASLRPRSSTGNLLTKSHSIWEEDSLLTTDVSTEMLFCPILAKHTKFFVNDFQSRAEHGKTWTDAKLHFTVLEKPVPKQTSDSARPSPALNPRAPAFVFTRSPALKSSPHLVPIPGPAWFPAFCAGTQTHNTAGTQHSDPGFEIVYGRKWSRETINELTKHFCWRSGEGMSPDHAAIAEFAKVVHGRFAATHGNWYAQEFMWHIREYAIASFKMFWKSDRPALANNVAYVSSALGLTAFIGDLFTHDLLPVSQVHLCLSFLAGQVTTIEHIHAMHLLLLHAGRKIWKVQDAKDFISNFADRVRAVEGGCTASLTGRDVKAEEVEAWLGEMQCMEQRWRSQGWSNRISSHPAGRSML